MDNCITLTQLSIFVDILVYARHPSSQIAGESHECAPVPQEGEQVSGLGQNVRSLMVSRAVDQLDLVSLDHGARVVVAQVDVLELGRGAVLGGIADAGLVVLEDGHGLLERHSQLL